MLTERHARGLSPALCRPMLIYVHDTIDADGLESVET